MRISASREDSDPPTFNRATSLSQFRRTTGAPPNNGPHERWRDSEFRESMIGIDFSEDLCSHGRHGIDGGLGLEDAPEHLT
jgi:hypothetical protein